MANIVSRQEWLVARKELLASEKAFVASRDALSAQRRELPWVAVDETYTFHGPDGQQSLADLFKGKSQLIVQHFMFGEDWTEGCPSCSFWADGFNGTTIHMEHRDTAFVAVSSAPYKKLHAFKQRMGWSFDWVSTHGSDFNLNHQVTFNAEQIESGSVNYNYRDVPLNMEELPGISVFVKSEATIFHTYSCYSRGLDPMNVVYQYLDLLPKGRDEQRLEFPMAWVRRHDQY